MIKESDVFKIGTLGKTHGIRGEISFIFDSDVFDQVDCPYLILKINGILVPFFMEEYRFKGKETALITFQDIDNDEKASKLQGMEVYFPRKFYEENSNEEDLSISWDFFIGFSAVDKHLGHLGIISDVDTETINTLFVISKGHEEILIPAVEEFILNIDNSEKEILFDLPEGMID